MKKYIITAVTCLALLNVAFAEEPKVSEEKLKIYRGAAKSMFETLKGELQIALKNGGPIGAIEVCSQKAPEIAAVKSKEFGFQMARTSLKPRNRAPDEWETKVMEKFAQRKAAGEDPTKIEFAEILQTTDGIKSIRYMKAIPTIEVCTICHGKVIEPNLAAKIKKIYPQDQALGFNIGDLRGAFTFIERLEK